MVETSDDRLAEIRRDEVNRQEVRRSLEERRGSSRRERIWKLLNQPFALWALSTLVVGLVGFAFTELRVDLVLRTQNKLLIDKLEKQGAARTEFAQLWVAKAKTPNEYVQAIDTALFDTTFARLYPEFKERSTVSIVWELKERAVTAPKDREYIENLLELARLKNRIEDSSIGQAQQDLFRRVREVMGKLDKL